MARNDFIIIIIKVELINEEDRYFIATATVRHEYASANDKGKAWEAVYEYCCKTKMLLNNRGTL